MTPTLASYVIGAAAILGIALSLWLGGYWLRRWIVPEFSGALARLAEITIAVALLLLSLQLLGTLSILTLGWIIAGGILIPLAAAGVGYRFARRDVEEVAAPAIPGWAFLVAIGVASWVVAEWSFPSQLNLDQGMFGGDTTWYHMPAAARFIQEGSTNHLHYTDPLRLAVWFYPQSSELLHGSLMGLMKSDWLSPLFNMFCVGVALLACWCVGRPYAVGPATLVAGSLVLSAGVMIETQPGEGRNDIMAFAFLVAFAVFLINGHQRKAPVTGEVDDKPDPRAALLDRGPLIMAGIAAGISIATKLSMLAPVGVIFLGMILVSGKGRRLATTLWMGGAMFVVGGYWYVRAMIFTGGNPAPQSAFGPLHLPIPDQMPLDPRPRFSVLHYIQDPYIYRYWFLPRLDDALGVLFPLILIMAAVAAVWLVFKSKNRVVRVLALASLATAVVYLGTPLTAAGQEGQPRGFFTNTRYLMPGLILALTLLPLVRQLRIPKKRANQTLIFLTIVFAVTVLTSPKWYPSFVPGALFLVIAIVWAPVGLTWMRDTGRFKDRPRLGNGITVGVVGAIILIAGVWGRGEEVGYANKHYTRDTLFLQDGGPQEAFSYTRDLRDKRIAIAGSGEIFFGQYGFYGVDRSNLVQYIGVEGDDGTFRLTTTCESFINQINDGDYDYLVTSEYTQDAPEADYRYPVRAWVKDDPNVEEVVAEPEITPQADYVYKINGPLSLDTCKKLEDKTLDPAAEAVAKREAEQEAEQARLEAAAAKESQ